jgi:hypothetical protein
MKLKRHPMKTLMGWKMNTILKGKKHPKRTLKRKKRQRIESRRY